MLLTIFSIQLVISFPRLVPGLTRHRRSLLTAQATLTFLPFCYFGQAWMPTPGLLAGSALLVLPDAVAWAAFGLVVLGVDVLQFSVGLHARDLAYTTVSTVLTGLVVFGLSRLSDMVTEVHQSRAELARLAVDQERLRFARDLHDLLGYSLSTITLKCELAYRLLPTQVERTQQELTEILLTSRQALADVRSVASGYRDMSLAVEISDAETMLGSLDIRVTTRVDSGTLPREVDTVLATVLREGLTNMLRHSEADSCTITTVRKDQKIRFRLASNGIGARRALLDRNGPGVPDASGRGGSGILNLAARVEALGGRLDAEVRGGWFVLEAVLDLPDAAEPAAAFGTPLRVLRSSRPHVRSA
ncbi:sensor histidine kinase [Streptomyces goshikiensis]|uniref:sensor histidine kinase n=1 Tax=Streptomyces goshikiensis TaxID=1942 RepID=UPI0036543B07